MGDAALLVELGDELDPEVNGRVHWLARQLEGSAGVVETVPAYASLLIEFEPARVTLDTLAGQVIRDLREQGRGENAAARTVEIPTRYGGEFGPDLEFVGAHCGLTPEEVIRLHTGEPFRVFMLGFAPGFPYAGPTPEKIAVARLETPRLRVPAGSVGLAGRQTGVYPRESPGGWQLIGRTEMSLFDPSRNPPALLQPGD